jgi:hypothetical protein
VEHADIMALVCTDRGSLVLHLCKNNVWDVRLDTLNDPPLSTLARIREPGAGSWPDRNEVLPEGCRCTSPDSYYTYPSP